jgi:hypothetical protein
MSRLILPLFLLCTAAHASEPASWVRWKLLHEPSTTLLSLTQCARVELEVRATRGRRGHLLLHVDDRSPLSLPVELRNATVIEATTLRAERVRTSYRGRLRVLGPCADRPEAAAPTPPESVP